MSEAIITVENLGKRYSLRHSPSRRLDGNHICVVYAIENSIGRIYIGQTADLTQRLISHNADRVRSTKGKEIWRLIATEECENRDRARWLEFQLKRSRGRRLKWLKLNRINHA